LSSFPAHSWGIADAQWARLGPKRTEGPHAMLSFRNSIGFIAVAALAVAIGMLVHARQTSSANADNALAAAGSPIGDLNRVLTQRWTKAHRRFERFFSDTGLAALRTTLHEIAEARSFRCVQNRRQNELSKTPTLKHWRTS
jgi:hypothetical protein